MRSIIFALLLSSLLTNFVNAEDRMRVAEDSTSLAKAPAGFKILEEVEDKKTALKAEITDVNSRMNEIDRKAEPLGNRLQSVIDSIEVHNREMKTYDAMCLSGELVESSYNKCVNWQSELNDRADSLNNQRNDLTNQLKQYLAEYHTIKNEVQQVGTR